MLTAKMMNIEKYLFAFFHVSAIGNVCSEFFFFIITAMRLAQGHIANTISYTNINHKISNFSYNMLTEQGFRYWVTSLCYV